MLPLVSEHLVEDVWFQALNDNDSDGQAVLRFKDYVTETWVEGHLKQWNHFSNDGPRTTNAVEGWHHKVNRVCRRPHPNVYRFVQLIKKKKNKQPTKQKLSRFQ